MGKIQTSMGLIHSAELGRVDVHEHLIIEGAAIQKMYPDFMHNDVTLLLPEIRAWKESGGGAIVDCSPIGAGRNPEKIEMISSELDLPIILTTGFHKASFYSDDHWVFSKNEDELLDIMISECSVGIMTDDIYPSSSEHFKIKAGAIKSGIDTAGFTRFFEKTASLTAEVSTQFKIPWLIHTEFGSPILELADWLEKRYTNPQKIVFCHMDKSFDYDLHKELIKQNFFIEFDSMIRSSPTLSELAKHIHRLFNEGLGNRILFAGDLARRSYWKCYGGKPGLAYLVSDLSTEFNQLGISNEMLDQIWIKNPEVLFSKHPV